MSNVVPTELVARIQFYETHAGPWVDRADQIGLSPAEAAAIADKAAAARSALRTQAAAQLAARAATSELHRAMAALSTAGSDAILKIRAKAATDGDGVYALASIPAPAAPSPVPAPGQPTRFEVRLAQTGALTLTWRCKNPKGVGRTVYQIARRIGDAGRFELLGTIGVRRFTDDTIPAGSSAVAYRVTALRSTRVGPAAFHLVNLGVAPGAPAAAPSLQFAA